VLKPTCRSYEWVMQSLVTLCQRTPDARDRNPNRFRHQPTSSIAFVSFNSFHSAGQVSRLRYHYLYQIMSETSIVSHLLK
jgi:hypothetical protein